MSRHVVGMVGADGMSAGLPMGVSDQSEGAMDLFLTPEVEAKLASLYENSELDDLKAKFKLEVVFSEARSRNGTFPGMIAIWTNGGFAHGGGDESVYLCPTRLDSGKFCNEPLHISFVSKSVAVCPSCRQAHKPGDLSGQVFARLTTSGWANLLFKVFQVLSGDADIRIGMHRGQLRTNASEALTSQGAGNRVDKLRREREWISYPLSAIVKDTAAGSDIHTRIKAFLEA